MLRLAIILITISISLLIVVLEKKRENADTEDDQIVAERKEVEVEDESKKNLTNLDKIGIIHLIILFLVICVDIIDMFDGGYLYDNLRAIFRLVYDLEFISWLVLIPIFFVIVLIKLIRSLKKENNGSVIASISLILNVVTELVTLGTYASHF